MSFEFELMIRPHWELSLINGIESPSSYQKKRNHPYYRGDWNGGELYTLSRKLVVQIAGPPPLGMDEPCRTCSLPVGQVVILSTNLVTFQHLGLPTVVYPWSLLIPEGNQRMWHSSASTDSTQPIRGWVDPDPPSDESHPAVIKIQEE